MIKYDKIVRDKIPEIIGERGGTCKVRTAREVDAVIYLLEKIKEEADELLKVINLHSAVDELADMQEIIMALAKKQGYTMEQIELARKLKRDQRGGFDKNIILVEASKEK